MDINGVSQNSAQNYYSNPSSSAVENKIVTNNVTVSNNENNNAKSVDNEAVNKAINKLNKFLEDDKTHAEYSVHQDLNTIMIKIIDDNTKEVIMEVPPEKILDMVASMCRQFGLLDRKA